MSVPERPVAPDRPAPRDEPAPRGGTASPGEAGGPPPGDEVARFVASLRTELPPAWVAAVEDGDPVALDRAATGPEAAEVVRRIAGQGWFTPDWPRRYGGRDLGHDDAMRIRRERNRWRIGDVSSAIGTGWVGPAVLRFGSDAAKDRLLPRIARNEDLWCQLFSEPEAGSDLAAVRTTARRDGDTWTLDGAKVWTSRADRASWGLAVARTDSSVPKHAGLTCFCVDMRAPGVTIRPIRQMTGDAEFFEVRLDGCVVPDELRVGEPGEGWTVVRAVLAFERTAGSGAGAATPGSVVGRGVEELIGACRDRLDPARADELMRVYVEARVVELNNRRTAAERAAGAGPVPPFNKVLQAEHTKRLQRAFIELGGLDALAYEPDDPWAAPNAWAFLRVQAKTIAGGTSEVLRDQIAERGLGLPRDPDPTRHMPWSDAQARRTEDRS